VRTPPILYLHGLYNGHIVIPLGAILLSFQSQVPSRLCGFQYWTASWTRKAFPDSIHISRSHEGVSFFSLLPAHQPLLSLPTPTTMSPPILGSGSPPQPTYMIGPRKPSKPLVSVEQVQDHLQLLDAFHRLRVTVEQGKDNRIPGFAVRMDKENRWRWFIHLAIDRCVFSTVHLSSLGPTDPYSRFEKWVEALQFARPGKFLAKYHPPLDVCMVWHAYMLCPR